MAVLVLHPLEHVAVDPCDRAGRLDGDLPGIQISLVGGAQSSLEKDAGEDPKVSSCVVDRVALERATFCEEMAITSSEVSDKSPVSDRTIDSEANITVCDDTSGVKTGGGASSCWFGNRSPNVTLGGANT